MFALAQQHPVYQTFTLSTMVNSHLFYPPFPWILLILYEVAFKNIGFVLHQDSVVCIVQAEEVDIGVDLLKQHCITFFITYRTDFVGIV